MCAAGQGQPHVVAEGPWYGTGLRDTQNYLVLMRPLRSLWSDALV